MNTNTQNRYDFYINAAAELATTCKIGQVRKALTSVLDFTPAEVKAMSDDEVRETAKANRTGLLHRARAVKSSAKRAAA